MNRRSFLGSFYGVMALAGARPTRSARPIERQPCLSDSPIDRRARVARHDPVVREVDPLSVLTVGNGRFAFTADITGLQTFPAHYREIPLATQAEWGWHSFPNPARYELHDALETYHVDGRPVSYPCRPDTPAGDWLRKNPHRLSLARIGFDLRRRDGTTCTVNDLSDVWQTLDLWNGALVSRLRCQDRAMQAWTWVHPDSDLVAVRFEAPGWEVDQIAVVIAFPYGSAIHTGDPADWTQPDRHLTELERSQNGAVSWRRTLDDDTYWVDAAWTEGGRLERQGAHTFRLAPPVQASVFEFAVRFSPAQTAGEMPRAGTVRDASARHWNRFWTGGGTLDLSDSSDPRAPELERRIVLSEFLTSVQCAGSMPPQETGLTFNSWHGKFHLEMHWWHATHFALWDRVAVLERSLQWYKSVLPVARETARQQGYTGARWPKMVGPNGRESPSTINPFLVWQQPHPIYFAELVYRSRPEAGVLDAYGELVSESARFIASFLVRDAATGQFHLVPPLIPAQEIHSPESTVDPAFELAYFEYGLKVAQAWRERAGLKRMAAWDDILRNLAPIPHHEGLYVNAASAPDTFLNPEQRRDHPSLLGAYGMIPSERVDRRMMRRTLERVIQDWQWDETWGWDYPLVAMTAARVGQPSLAVDALLMDTPRNQYLPNGHNYQRPGLSIYLPGNGGLLAATAMMAAGWDGGPTGPAPGFPAGGWVIRSEGLQRMP